MSSKLFTVIRNKSSGKVIFSVLLLSLMLSGCGSKTTSTSPKGAGAYNSAKDGIKLTAKQQEIFNRTGQLDKNIPKKGLPAVAKEYSHFLNKGRTTMSVFSQRSEDYLGHAKEVFRKNGMPEELAYLAIVESGYNSGAKSHAGAVGAWQFMPYTGTSYGLKRDWWIDERLDPYKSVEAAATYLKRLHGYFDDWLLAIAAYNAGEGKIGRALKGTGAKDFFTLVERNHRLSDKAQLRKETIDYVPRFLAVSKIMRNLGPLGFDTVHLDKDPEHTRVTIKPGTDLKAMAKVTGASWEEFKEDNRAHLRYVSHAKHETYVYVPHHMRKVAEKYVQKGKSVYAWNYVTAPSSMKWSTLSKKTGVPVAALQAANPKYSSIRAGAKLRIPAGPGVKKPTFTALASKSSRKPKATKSSKAKSVKSNAGQKTYTVKAGESVLGIALKHGTTMDKLMKANKLTSANKIRIGQKLIIPSGGKAVAQKRTYTVRPGDTYWAIAQKYNLSTNELLQLNKKSKSSTLRPGDTLLVSMR